jgi:hypothetical protein
LTSSTQGYKNVFPNMTGSSILAITTLWSSSSMYILYIYIFFLIACFINSSLEVIFHISLVFHTFCIAVWELLSPRFFRFDNLQQNIYMEGGFVRKRIWFKKVDLSKILCMHSFHMEDELV